jgi:hypothetical protein
MALLLLVPPQSLLVWAERRAREDPGLHPGSDPTIDDLSLEDQPHLAALAEEFFTGTPITRLIWSFEVLLDGIAAVR